MFMHTRRLNILLSTSQVAQVYLKLLKVVSTVSQVAQADTRKELLLDSTTSSSCMGTKKKKICINCGY